MEKLLEHLGLLWVGELGEIIVTEAGFHLLAAQGNEAAMRSVIEAQVAKLQFPNPGMAVSYREDFDGILPYLFLLQVLRSCNNVISYDEYELFVNLARSQNDVGRIVSYIRSWRDLDENRKGEIAEALAAIPMSEGTRLDLSGEIEDDDGPSRYRRIHLNSSYQRSFFTYPTYCQADESQIECVATDEVDQLVKDKLADLKITKFDRDEDWFAYYGDPKQQPSWFTYLSFEVKKAESQAEAREKVEPHQAVVEKILSQEESEELKRLEIEKGIEDFYVERLSLLEPGLTLLGRQYPTPIGRIDLLCTGDDGKYVVVEIKAIEARDSVFGQILRYIGWVSRAFENVGPNVRGIIVATGFPSTAHYSRIGLLREDYQMNAIGPSNSSIALFKAIVWQY
jgi:hypothetical protein